MERSSTTTSAPRRASASAAASPMMPPPTTATSGTGAMQTLLKRVELRVQLVREPIPELGVELADRADLLEPFRRVDAQQLLEVLARDRQALGVERLDGRDAAD